MSSHSCTVNERNLVLFLNFSGCCFFAFSVRQLIFPKLRHSQSCPLFIHSHTQYDVCTIVIKTYSVAGTMWLTQTTSGQQENNVQVTNDSIADNHLRWMYSLVYGMSLIAIFLFSTARTVLLMKVNRYTLQLFWKKTLYEYFIYLF